MKNGATSYQSAAEQQMKSGFRRLGADRGGCGFCGRRVDAEDGFSLLHDADFVAGNDFDIFGIILEQLNLAGALLADELFVGEFRLFLVELNGERATALQLRHKGKQSNRDRANHD